MPEMDLDKLLAAAGSESVGKNAESILGLLQEANKVLGELDKVLLFLKKLEGSILVSAAVKLKAKEKGIELTPLTNEGLIPSSDTHKIVMENINKLNQEQLKGLFEAIQRYDKETQSKPKT